MENGSHKIHVPNISKPPTSTGTVPNCFRLSTPHHQTSGTTINRASQAMYVGEPTQVILSITVVPANTYRWWNKKALTLGEHVQ